MSTITLAQLHAEAHARYGPRQAGWAYQCPACGDVATGADVMWALSQLPAECALEYGKTAAQVLARWCLQCGATADDHTTTTVVLPTGQQVRVFDLAPARPKPLPHPQQEADPMTHMQRPTWTTTPAGERETTWHGETFHLAKDGRHWHLHRGPATPHIPSLATNGIAPLAATIGESTTMAGLILNGWAQPALTRDGDVYTHLDGARRHLPDLAAELDNAPAYTPARGEACVERALSSHLAECDATRMADTCPARDALAVAQRATMLTLMEQVVDAHPTVRWYKPAVAGQVVVHFAAVDEPRIVGGIGYDPHHRAEVSPWQVAAGWASSTESGHRARTRVPTAAQLAEEITRQVARVRDAVAATA